VIQEVRENARTAADLRGRTAEAELVQAVRIDRYGALAAGSATSVAGF
jgi:hypothetical protein